MQVIHGTQEDVDASASQVCMSSQGPMLNLRSEDCFAAFATMGRVSGGDSADLCAPLAEPCLSSVPAADATTVGVRTAEMNLGSASADHCRVLLQLQTSAPRRLSPVSAVCRQLMPPQSACGRQKRISAVCQQTHCRVLLQLVHQEQEQAVCTGT